MILSILLTFLLTRLLRGVTADTVQSTPRQAFLLTRLLRGVTIHRLL